MRIWQVSLLGLALGIGAAWAQEPVPSGDEFQINTYTTNQQKRPAAAMAPDGEFVVVWRSWDYPGASYDTWVAAQRYDATGTPLGGEIQVQDSGCCDPFTQAVAMGADGHFVVVWAEEGYSQTEVFARLYDSSGNPLGTEFQVNSYTEEFQGNPAVSMDSSGNFVVVWGSHGFYVTDPTSIEGQRFDAAGNPLGSEFQVNTYTTVYPRFPSVGVDPSGDFVVVWGSQGSYGTDTDALSIQGQRYDAGGAPVGGQFQVNSYTTNDQKNPFVSIDQDGDFVVVWESLGSYGTDPDFFSIQAQRYDASGQQVGSQFQVNTYTTNRQWRSSVAADAEGNFVVTWQSEGSYGTDSSGQSIQAQRYDANGAPVGGQFEVNTYTTDNQSWPAVAVNARGGLVVVWESEGSYGTDLSGSSIQGQRFSTGAIFTDGFESGDTSAWSSTVQ